MIKKSALNHFCNTYFLLFTTGDRFHHHLLRFSKKKKKVSQKKKSKALQLFISDAVMMMGDSFIFVLVLAFSFPKEKKQGEKANYGE